MSFGSTFGGFGTAAKPATTFGAPAAGTAAPNPFGQPAAGTSTGFGTFGQPQQQAAGTTTGGFGQPSTQGTNNIFGQPTQNQQQQQQQPSTFGSTTSNIFGNASNTNATQSTPSLFGNTQAQQGQAAPSLFGNTQNQTQNQATPSLFGNTQNQTQPAFGATTTQATNPLFGGASTTGTQPSNAFGGFGASTATQPAQQTSNIFGAPQTNQPAQASNTFGFGASTNGFGQRPAQSNLGLSTMQAQAPLFTKSTKFNDLPDELKKVFESIDSHIQGRVQISKDLHQQKVGEESMKGQELIRNMQKELAHTASITHSDFLFKDDLKAKVDQAVQDTIIATRIVDGFKNPQQNGAYLKNYASFPFEYFARVAETMKERLRWFQSTIEQIERKLALTANHAPQSPQAIAATLQAQHSTFINLANKTALLDAELDKIKKLYTQLWRARTGSMRDPFSDVDRANGGEFGIGSLSV